MSKQAQRARELRAQGLPYLPQKRKHSWSDEALDALLAVYPTQGIKAAMAATGKSRCAVTSMARVFSLYVGRKAKANAIIAATVQKSNSVLTPMIQQPPKIVAANRPLPRKHEQPRMDISGEPINEEDFFNHRVTPAASAPKLKGRVIASVFDLAEAL